MDPHQRISGRATWSRAARLARAVLGLLLASLPCGSLQARPLAPPQDPLRVVVTVPELEDVTTRVGGDLVQVQCLTRGTENLHSVRLRPSFLVATSKADLFVQVGLSMEHAWVPGLIESARNPRLRGDGLVTVGDGIPTLDVPQDLSRRMGTDVHPMGNPHVNLDPRFGPHAANVVCAALVRERPDRRAELESRRDAYVKEVAEHARRWARVAKALEGRKAVEFHAEHRYLFAACGVELVATLEVKPGVPPTPAHLAQVVQLVREKGVGIVVHSPWGGQRVAEEVASKTGTRVVELDSMAGARDGTRTWIGLMDHLHDALLAGYGVTLPAEDEPADGQGSGATPGGDESGGGRP